MFKSHLLIYLSVSEALVLKIMNEAVDRCMDDSWGFAADVEDKSAVANTDLVKLNSKCIWTQEEISQAAKVSVNFYKDAESFKAYQGIDMNPEKHYEYYTLSNWNTRWRESVKPWVKGTNGPAYQTDIPVISECELIDADGSSYRSQRVGPFTSAGGYDFWQFGLPDVWQLQRKLVEHPNGFDVDYTFHGAVTPDGRILGYPPIHMHHIHVGPEIGIKVKELSLPYLSSEIHGDYVCLSSAQGSQCMFERSPQGYAKTINSRWDLEGEINDARPHNSPPMTWWFQNSIQYRPRTAKTIPINQMFITGPGRFNFLVDQLDLIAPFPAFAKEESFYWYTGDMPESGHLIRNKLHAHADSFQHAFFFRAVPKDLGLHQFPLRGQGPQGGYIPVRLSETTYSNFNQLQEDIFHNLARSQMTSSDEFGKPHLICEAFPSVESIDGHEYDRRAPTCCKSWSFQRGTTYTVLAFLKRFTNSPESGMQAIPASLNMHVHWITSYVSTAAARKSHYYFGNTSRE